MKEKETNGSKIEFGGGGGEKGGRQLKGEQWKFL